MKSLILILSFFLMTAVVSAAQCPCSRSYTGDRIDVIHGSFHFYDRSVVFSPCDVVHAVVTPDSNSTNCGQVVLLYRNGQKVKETGCFQVGVRFRGEVLNTFRRFKCGETIDSVRIESPRKKEHHRRCRW